MNRSRGWEGASAAIRLQMPDGDTCDVDQPLLVPFETALDPAGVQGIAHHVSATCNAPDSDEKVDVSLMCADPFWTVSKHYKRIPAIYRRCHDPFEPEYPFGRLPVIALNVRDWTDEFGRKTPLCFRFDDGEHQFKVRGLVVPPYEAALREVKKDVVAHKCRVWRDQEGIDDLETRVYYIDPFWLITARDAEPFLLADQYGDCSAAALTWRRELMVWIGVKTDRRQFRFSSAKERNPVFRVALHVVSIVGAEFFRQLA